MKALLIIAALAAIAFGSKKKAPPSPLPTPPPEEKPKPATTTKPAAEPQCEWFIIRPDGSELVNLAGTLTNEQAIDAAHDVATKQQPGHWELHCSKENVDTLVHKFQTSGTPQGVVVVGDPLSGCTWLIRKTTASGGTKSINIGAIGSGMSQSQAYTMAKAAIPADDPTGWVLYCVNKFSQTIMVQKVP